MYSELSFNIIMLPCARGIVLHQDTFFSFSNCAGLKYIGNKSPVIRLPKVWSRLINSVCTGLLLLSLRGVRFPV